MPIKMSEDPQKLTDLHHQGLNELEDEIETIDKLIDEIETPDDCFMVELVIDTALAQHQYYVQQLEFNNDPVFEATHSWRKVAIEVLNTLYFRVVELHQQMELSKDIDIEYEQLKKRFNDNDNDGVW